MPSEKIGDTMYLFTMPSGGYSDTLVISAHGGINRNNPPTFQVPDGVGLQFYSEHGKVTDDFGIKNFATGGKNNQRTDLIVGPQRSYDYDLSKYQGSHNRGGETYESIESAQAFVLTYRTQLQAGIEEAARKGLTMPVTYIPTNFDVLTIRNRWWINGKTLSSALHDVLDVHDYRLVHCYFCRSFY